jgi:hypothetical protein
MTKYTRWNYRVVKKCHKHEVTYGIHEVFYNASDTPLSCTESPVAPWGETLEDLITDIARMRAATEKPTLNYDDFLDSE